MSQETIEVDSRLRFDEVSLRSYLVKKLPGFHGDLHVRKFGYGQSNPTYFLKTGTGEYVLRKQPPGKLIKGAHALDREARVIQALGQEGYTVPRVHVFCDDTEVIGTSFYVMSFVKGHIPDNALQSMEPSERGPAMFEIVRSLAQLHSYSPKKLGLLDGERPFGRMGGFYSRQLATLSRTAQSQVSNSGGKMPPLEKMPQLLDLFEANLPADASCVIHGDWKPDNVIFSGGKVIAVLDWELSTIGHPMSDLANMCLPYHVAGNKMGYPVFGSDIPAEQDVHRAYCEVANVPFPIKDWPFFKAFSCFRLAVIAHGVGMRASLGTSSASGADPAFYLEAANSLADIGYKIMIDAYGASRL